MEVLTPDSCSQEYRTPSSPTSPAWVQVSPWKGGVWQHSPCLPAIPWSVPQKLYPSQVWQRALRFPFSTSLHWKGRISTTGMAGREYWALITLTSAPSLGGHSTPERASGEHQALPHVASAHSWNKTLSERSRPFPDTSSRAVAQTFFSAREAVNRRLVAPWQPWRKH